MHRLSMANQRCEDVTGTEHTLHVAPKGMTMMRPMPTPSPTPNRAIKRCLLAGLWALALTLAACGANKPEVKDPAHIETLRLKITKVRNAIDETRATITLSRGAPYLPELYVRLAEFLSEEARYHYQLAYEREQRASRVLHVPQVRVLKEQAISIYKMVLVRFPASGLGPRVLFNIGHEYRELGNFDEMRATLQQLVREFPDSPLRFDALLVLGDFHFDRNELQEAKGFYNQITSGTLNKMSGLAHYKVAWVWVNLGECNKALADFDKAILRSNEWETYVESQQNLDPFVLQQQGIVHQSMDVRRESLVDLAYCYARERKPETTIPYLRKMANSHATYVAALERFANRYRVMEQSQGAIAVSRELLRLGPTNQDRINDAMTLALALKKAKAYERLGPDLRLFARALTHHYNRINLNREERDNMVNDFELHARDLLTSAQSHLNDSPETKRPPLAASIAEGYAVYMDTFPNSPRRLDMLLNYADVLTVAQDDFEAGLRFAEAARMMDTSPEQADALYDAIVHFQTSLDREADRSQFERVTARAALRRSAEQLLEYSLEPDKERRVKFAIAQSYYDAGLYGEAIDKLTAVAYEYPATDEADAAVKLVLDSFNTLNDHDGLMYAVRRFIAANSPATPQLRAELQPVLTTAEQRKLDDISLKAAGEDGADLAVLEEFAVQNTGTDLGERALLNAFVAARAVGDSDRLYKLAEDISRTYPNSEQLPGVYATIAQTAVARFEYDQAIRYLQLAANANPAQRVRLLVATGALLEQLADFSGAESVYNEAIRTSEGSARVDALNHLAALLEQQADPRQIVAKLQPYANEGGPEIQARLGLALIALGRFDEAEANLQRALDDPTASVEAMARAHFGNAELMLATFNEYPEPEDLTLLQELIFLVEIIEESYLGAAREGIPAFSAAALSRLSFAAQHCANRFERMRLPGGLGANEQQAIRQALEQRAAVLRDTSEQALDLCARYAWTQRQLTPTVRECMARRSLSAGAMVAFDALNQRSTSSLPHDIAELQQRISRNPEDQEGLIQLGLRFLEHQDHHVARLAFVRAIQAGGGATAQNLLGIASYRAGDISGAFEAFATAADGGLEAGRQNLISILKQLGLDQAAQSVTEVFPREGKDGGRLL